MAMKTRFPCSPEIDVSRIPQGRLGVLGGTFDPIHMAHLIIAEEARTQLLLDYVIFVPTMVSPLKPGGTFFSNEDRYEMTRLAIQDNARFCVSRVDLDRKGPSFTVDTLKTIKACCTPGMQLFFIMGMDSLCSLTAWYRPEEIIRLARLAVISRPGFVPDLGALEEGLPGVSQATDLIETLKIGISATDIRARLRQGRSIRYLVPASVEAYIHDHYPKGDSDGPSKP